MSYMPKMFLRRTGSTIKVAARRVRGMEMETMSSGELDV